MELGKLTLEKFSNLICIKEVFFSSERFFVAEMLKISEHGIMLNFLCFENQNSFGFCRICYRT